MELTSVADRAGISISLLVLLATCCPQDPVQPPVELAGLHNVVFVTPRVTVGGEPQGDEAFEELRRRGITTIISVDGAKPDVDAARRQGLSYFHIPIGYDGVPAEKAAQLARVADEIQSPVYIHCHHGKHRGPAAAAIVCLASESITQQQAEELMMIAGTSRDYAGLWRDVRSFVRPAPGAALPPLTEIADIDSMAALMAQLDRHFDRVKLCKDNNWNSQASHPDLVPIAEAALVHEGFRESVRKLSPDHSAEFRTWLHAAERNASLLVEAIRHGDTESASKQVKSLQVSCLECHTHYRNH